MKSRNCDEEKPGEPEGAPRSARIHPGRGGSAGKGRTRPGPGREFQPGQGGSAGKGRTRPGPGPGREFQPGFGRASRGRGLRGGSAALEDLLQDLKNELEKRQAKKIPEIPHQETPAQGQEEKKQQEDVKSSISRCGKVTFQLPLGLEERVCHFSWRSSALKDTLRKLQASVTLDPDTAHAELVVSEDGKRVWRGSAPRRLPERPERFEHWRFVLGRPGFARGRHCWHVDVGAGGDWAVGVARDSVPRKGRLSPGPQGGVWALESWGGRLRALTARKATPVAPRRPPRAVSVHLDCRARAVAFLDAEDGALLFVFSGVSSGGERLRPWLWVVGARSQLRVWP